MADNNTRTVAEKLAAAKKKHKAYLKDKALKNNANKSKDQETENVMVPSDSSPTGSNETQIQEIEHSHENNLDNIENVEIPDSSDTNEYGVDLPLPHYSMDNNYQASSLPDPLSFFDNFNYTNVGTTFQNFTQPLTSLFNNTNRIELDEVMGSPNQILVGENTINNTNIGNENNTQLVENIGNVNTIGQQFFSYDRFKINAINNPISENKYQEDTINLEKKGFMDEPVFDQFTNSAELLSGFENSVKCSQNSENFVVSTSIVQSNTEKFIPNIFHNAPGVSIPEIIKEDAQVTLEVKPDIKIDTNESGNINLNFEANNNILADVKPALGSQSIQNLSDEMKDYIEGEQHLLNYSNIPPNEELEKNEQELMTLLEKQNAKCIELSQKLYESEMKYSKLATDYRNLEINKQIETDMKCKGSNDNVNDLSKLRVDLESHLQTIGMLVAEKTELSTLLQETQSAFRNEASQNIDLQNEIKEMKIYYSDVEHELQMLKSEKENLNSCQKQQADMFEKIREELNETKIQCEGYIQDLMESREKLKALTENNATLHRQTQELTGQLSMANIKIQQLTMQESSHLESQIQTLVEEKAAFEKQISALNDTLKTLSKEREECSLQYQQYVEQLNDQISSLVQRLEQQQRENDQLKLQEENRVKHIGDLEKQLQNVKSDNTSYNLQRNNSFLKKEIESSAELTQSLQTEKEQLNSNLTRALSDKEMLEKEMEGYKFSISQLESTIEELRGSRPDNAELLATMESDKVAASRAISQNNELKKQMDGMQEVMLKVNNDNVQLTEIITRERKTNKDLLEKLQKTEISLQTLADAIEIKDKELVHLRDQIESITKQIVHQEQLSDRLRHYEAQNHSSPSLQVELQEAKQMIAHLTNELNIMKKNQLNQTTQMSQTVPISQVNQMNQTVQFDQLHQMDQINNTQANSFPQESDSKQKLINSDLINELRTQLGELKIRNEELESLLQNVQSTDPKRTDANGNEHLDKNTAMMHLEKKFLRTMEEIARLTEEKQRLEHLVLQLQGETETIGEYVTLYQQQRSILKQKAMEKDQQLQQLTNDRESIKANLDRLNNLVKKLINEKGAIPKELLDQHEHYSHDRNDLCMEHQRIHQEINKITSNGVNNSGVINDSNSEIAEEIITLLSEIKSSNLVQPNEETVHHCAWCSGKLITV